MFKKYFVLLLLFIIFIPASGFCASWQFDSELAAKQKADYQKWLFDNVVEAYKQVGHRDPRWDDLAIESLRAIAVYWAKAPDRKGNELFVASQSGQKAIKLGCHDPMILYVVARTADDIKNMNKSLILSNYFMSGMSMKDRNYPASRKIYAYVRSATAMQDLNTVSTEPGSPIIKMLENATVLFPELVKDTGFDYADWVFCCTRMRESYQSQGETPEASHRIVYEALEKAGASKSLLLTIEGDFWIDYAWQARGTDFKVSSEGRRLAKERLEKALKASVEAWHADETNPLAPMNCISAMLYYGGTRDEMEFCFQHAIKNEPGNYHHYGRKLNWLEPKWRGSIPDMLAFGRECLATQSWDAEIPFILVQAHRSAAKYGKGRYHSLPQQSYFQTEGVWPEIKTVYDEFLKRYPKDYKRRCEYAYYASLAEDWETVHREFQIIGDNVYWPAFNKPSHYQALVYKARKHMEAKAATPESEPKTGD